LFSDIKRLQKIRFFYNVYNNLVMKALDFIINFKFIIFPEFYTVKDLQNNEYVFLKTNETAIDSLELVKDKL